MAWFAVTSLMRTVELELLPPNPRVVLDDTNAAEALHGRLRELLHFLEKSENQFNADDVPMQGWKARLKDVALRIEDEIESKVIESCSRRQSTSTLAISSHYISENAIEELTKSVGEEYSQMKAAGLARAIIINESLWISKEIERIFYERMCSDLVQDYEERKASRCTTKVSQIWRIPMLRHLKFSPVFMFDTPNVVLEHLQTVYWLRPFQCTKEVFLRIRNAKVMGISIPRVKKFDDKYSLAENWLDDLINLQKLEKLKIDSYHDDPIILPHASAFPVQLRMLTLKGTLMSWDAMEVIGMLPNLEVVKLQFEACKGQHWKVSGGGFPKLKSLLIQGMKLKQWTATDNAFPILERLIIKHCIHLEKIPSTFDELYTLQLIELYGCHSSLVRSAERIKQQQEELLGNDWLVVHAYSTKVATTIIEGKEQAEREEFEEQELEKLHYVEDDEDAKLTNICGSSSYPDSSYFARQIQEEEDAKLTDVNFFNCFEDDFDHNDIN
nr:putative late blight resistance protein homolog R1A-10 isoform X1 [Ipomoea batatas]GME20943.1 putative late blight resistance protein homolog R1A-10 isoform X1 [Ipomoea batatas]